MTKKIAKWKGGNAFWIMSGILLILWSIALQNTRHQVVQERVQEKVQEKSASTSTAENNQFAPDKLILSFDSGSEVQKWNAMALQIIASTNTSPPEASRFLAILHIAMFEAINSIDQIYEPYRAYLEIQEGVAYDKEVVIASAAKQVIDTIYPQYNILTLKEFTKGDQLGGVSSDLGIASASQIIELRTNDGHDKQKSFTISGKPGGWTATPPYYETALLPHWGGLDLFLLDNQAIYPLPPHDLTSSEYTQEFQEVHALGSVDSTKRTNDQSEIAKFWADGKRTFTPPGHWNLIARNVLQGTGMTLEQEARFFALLNIAMADVGIQTWKAKFDYQYWRPIDAIRLANTDGNGATKQSPQWENYIETPNFPEYPSGHSAFSGAGSTVLSAMIGDQTPFTTYSLGLPGVQRSFESFSQAANEAGMSRIYGGIHFQRANTEGLRIGREIGEQVFSDVLVKKEPSPL